MLKPRVQRACPDEDSGVGLAARFYFDACCCGALDVLK